MNKKIFIILVCIVLILLVSVLFFLKRGGEQNTDSYPTDNGGTQFPDSAVGDVGKEGDFLVPAISGASIQVKDIRKNPEATVNEGPYHRDFEFGREKDDMDFTYQFFYSDIDRNFTIILQDLPLSVARKKAEDAFISELGVTKEEVCRLPVYVGTTNSWSEEYAGINLGLSFCAGSVEIP